MRLPGTVALRGRDFRLYWLGYLMEVSGQQMLRVGQGWLIYELSGSAIYLGLAGLAQAVPATILTFLGGALADRTDQRRLLIGIQIFQMSLLAILGTLTALGVVQVWHLLLIVAASSAGQSLENPARQALFPRLIQRQTLMDAVAINATVYPGSRFFGPALGGVLMAWVGLSTGSVIMGAAALFYLTAAGYVANSIFLYSIRVQGAVKAQTSSIFKEMATGLQFIGRNGIFALLIGMTYFSNFFGWSFHSIFPIFAKDIFHAGADGLGYMHSALGAGSLLGATLAANLAGVRWRGWLIAGGLAGEGILLVLFAHTPWFAVALVALLLAGTSQSLFNVTTQSTLQYLVPNEFRGRVMGVWGMTHTAVQPTGQLVLGVLAGLRSAPWAVTLGGSLVFGFALLITAASGRLRNLNLAKESTPEAAAARPAVHGAPSA